MSYPFYKAVYGKHANHNHVDNIWQFTLEDPNINIGSESIKTDLIQIVAMDAKLNPYVDRGDDSKVDNYLICLILTTFMAGMVRNPAKTMDKKTKLAGWLFPIPTGWCRVSGNSLDSSRVVIFHTVSRMKPGGML